jgi:prepilin-type N-terminal cleavage/methylation domain-containing protein
VHRAGFTLIEVMLAAVIMAGAVLGLAALIPTVALQTEVAHESNLAMAATHQITEAIRQYADDGWLYVWRAYNADPSDDPNGSGTAAGNAFAVAGLTGPYSMTQVGTVTFHLDETATNARVGLPKDLDGDGLATTMDVSATYALLPFTVSVDWKGRNGTIRHVEVSSQVVDY